MEIPHDQLAPETLRSLIEEFVTRDGEVVGHADVSLESRVEAVKRQLKSGEATIIFDEEEETVSIISRKQRGQ